MSRNPEITSKIMSAIKSKDTKPEKKLGSAMWRLGLRYRKNYRELPGSPDFAFTKVKLAVFCDGDFWHGNNWKLRGLNSFEEELAGYSKYWRDKLARNVERDIEVNKKLGILGWFVLRFWESEIYGDVEKCASIIFKSYNLILVNLLLY